VKRITKIILFFLAASIFSIGSLLFYNTELEKSSLKTTANIISRFDDEWYKNLITETLFAEFSRVEAENAFANKSSNFNSSAFKIWSKSQLQKEAINSSVNFISLSGNLLGGFGSIYPSFSLDKFIDTNSVLEEIQIFEEPTESESKKIIRGIFPIKDEYSFLGYLDVSILADLNNFGFSSHPEFISTGKLNEKAILKLDKLIILDYRNKELKIVYGNLNPTVQLNETILGAEFTKANDAWIETDINNSEYLIYLKKVLVSGLDRIIAVALREKELSIGLFDFFKIFFSHALILLIIVIVYFAINYKSRLNYQFDLRSKLLLGFLIISLIPLVLTAFYFRNLTEEKNKDAIYYKLGKRAFSVENYINENYDEKLEYDIYKKASDDLNINYSVFRKNKLEYSSHDLLYDVGLFSKMMNPVAYNELIQNGSQEILLDENVDKYKFNAFYYKGNFRDEEIIIEVADGFNNIRLPLSGSEVDVFLFGIYSLAFVFIIIFSAIFANQISLPIRRITSATKSVAAGDLSLELKTDAKGELGELVSGFQYMIKELKKNQTMLAEIEREEAWKEMAKQVAHEIKNPLTPMKLSVQQLITAYRDKSDKFDLFFEKVTNTILNQIETLKNIATEFSNFARMPKLKVEIINFNEVINSSINLFTDEKVKISFETLNDKTEISGDAEQLKRTIINLIRNSIQANAIKINLYTKEFDDQLELFVEDNGIGIAEEYLEKIFDTNFTTKEDGMGLGLSMAKRYMRSTGGNIEIIESSNSGTIIKLTFPK
ncbi:MAG: ATP-binding protein, partial [Melioribacteraceae bacterium]|nr:ATP-binding protein [Melioribacteraceae bacterium]